MIASLKGLVQSIGADHAVIEVGGVGYLVQASTRTLGSLQPDVACFLLIETSVREDAITLTGFGTTTERDWFRLLTSVQGVGAKVALALLGTLTAEELARAITFDDKAMISRANGVGPRLAARIITELKGKAPAGTGGSSGSPEAAPASSAAADALSALENLGFRPAEALRFVTEAEQQLGTELPASTLIREALKRAKA